MTNNLELSDTIRINSGPSKGDNNPAKGNNNTAKDPVLDPKQQGTKSETSAENQRFRNSSSGDHLQNSSSPRDPAVSISPSIAPHKTGDIITASVDHLDAEGRRVIETSIARYILKLDTHIELTEKQHLKLVIRATDRTLTADITDIDDQKLEKPIPAKLTILTLHEKAASHLEMLQQKAEIETDLENLAKSLTDAPPKSLKADIYQPYDNQKTLADALTPKNKSSDIIASVVTSSQAPQALESAPLDHTRQAGHSGGGLISENSGVSANTVASANTLVTAALASPQVYGQPLYRFAAQIDVFSGVNTTRVTPQPLITQKYFDLTSSTSEGATLLRIAQDDLAGKITVPLVTPALNAAGKSVFLTLVDPSLSTVQSLRLEKVLNVEAQSVENLKHVPAPAQFLSQAKGLPSTITTDSGRYLVSGEASKTLIGQLLNIQPLQISASSETFNAPLSSRGIDPKSINQQGIRPTIPDPATKLYSAQFTPPDDLVDDMGGTAKTPPSLTPETVNLQIQTLTASNQILNPDQGVDLNKPEPIKPEVPLGSLPIDSVRIINSYLGPKGPTSDIILQTVIGKIALTLPSVERPVAGDFVQISGLYPSLSPLSGSGVSDDQSSRVPSANASPSPQVPIFGNSPLDAPEDLILTMGGKVGSPLFAPLLTQHPIQNDKNQFTVLEDAVELSLATGSSEILSSISARSAEGGAKLTNSLLFFLSALGKKNPKSSEVLGKEAENALKEKNQAAARALAADLPRHGARLQDTPAGEWRQFPFLYNARDGVAQLLSFMIRQEDKSEDHRSGESRDTAPSDHKVTEFMVEVDYSLMGKVRLDGRVTGSHFDLIVTVSDLLSLSLKSDLAGLFYSANDANGFTGSLVFKTSSSQID